MKRLLSLAALAALATACAFAQAPTCGTQTIPICTAGSPSGDAQIKPQAVPTSTGTVTTYDAYLKSVTVANTTAGAVTFTLADRQASPIAVLSAVSIAANTTYVIVFPTPQWCPGGFTVIAGGAGLNYAASWKQ
jgi:hypothetical protein